MCGEESSIRDKVSHFSSPLSSSYRLIQALISAQEIVRKMNENQITKHLFPLLNKLSNREW